METKNEKNESQVPEENEESEEEIEAEDEAEDDTSPAPVDRTPAKPLKPLKVAEPNKLYFRGKLKGKYNSNIFKVVEFVSRLVDTIPLDFGPDGMRIWTSFLNMVGVVEATLDKSDFATYELAEPTKVYVKSATLLNALNMAERGEMEIKGNAIILTEGKSRFSVPLLESDAEGVGEKSINELKFAKTLEFSASDMSKTVGQMRKFVGGADDTTIKLDINNLRIKLSAGDINKAEAEIALTKGTGNFAEGEPSLVGSYSADLLKEVLKLKDIASTTKLQFQNDYPLRMDFNNGTVKGMIVLAPRVESN